MYVFNSPEFKKAVLWFQNNNDHSFSYLCVCLSDNTSKGCLLYEYIQDNKERIDNITGEEICFLATIKNRSKRMARPSRIYDEEAYFFDEMEKQEAGRMQEKMSNRIFNEVITYCNCFRVNLPALIFVPIFRGADLFPSFGCVVKSVADLNLAFDLLNVFTMYKNDIRNLKVESRRKEEDLIREMVLSEEKKLIDYLSTVSLDEQVEKLIMIIRANTTATESFISLLKNNPSKYYAKAMIKFIPLREMSEAIETTRQIRTIIKSRKRLDVLKKTLSSNQKLLRKILLKDEEIKRLECDYQNKNKDILEGFLKKLCDEFGLDKKLSEELLISGNLKDIMSCAQNLINEKKSSVVWICPRCKEVVPQGTEECPYCTSNVRNLLRAEAEHYERMTYITYTTEEQVRILVGRTEVQRKQNQYEKAVRDGKAQAEIDKAKTNLIVVRHNTRIKNEISDSEKSQLMSTI